MLHSTLNAHQQGRPSMAAAPTRRFILRSPSSLPSSLQHRLRSFCSSSRSPDVSIHKTQKFVFDDSGEGGSAVYRHALKFQRPSIIKWKPQLSNSVSFTGTVDRPIEHKTFDDGTLTAFTLLNVKPPPTSNRSIKILLTMRNEVAEQSVNHLKTNDCIHVSGRLMSKTKVTESGRQETQYKVGVKEINFVRENAQSLKFKVFRPSYAEGETASERLEKRLHLWQIFFSNPYEWRDCRKRKTTPNQPDFKHKDSGEALWISNKDPPWIKRQLQIQDSRFSQQGRGKYDDDDSCASFSHWL